ncbi:MAG: hypothetical protein Q7R87_05030 [Nanoarchaeota archaeon]|nr:hypothetical protein [Nanoarchaeota archaeon]
MQKTIREFDQITIEVNRENLVAMLERVESILSKINERKELNKEQYTDTINGIMHEDTISTS